MGRLIKFGNMEESVKKSVEECLEKSLYSGVQIKRNLQKYSQM